MKNEFFYVIKFLSILPFNVSLQFAGIIDAGAGIFDEVKNLMSEFRDPTRFPRVFNNIQIQKYNPVDVIYQLQYQRLVKNYEDRFVYFINEKQKNFGNNRIFYCVFNTKR